MIIEIDTLGLSPIYEQLRNQVVLGIASNKLVPGEALPSVRRLAADLGINFHTVNKAYTLLCEEGYIKMDRRKGAVVAQSLKNNEFFFDNYLQGLMLNAAEAICHKINEKEFVTHCRNQYQNALGKKVNGGK